MDREIPLHTRREMCAGVFSSITDKQETGCWFEDSQHIERFMSLCIWYHINALELVGGIASRLSSENPRSRMFSPCRGFPFIVGLLVPEAVERPHNRVHS